MIFEHSGIAPCSVEKFNVAEDELNVDEILSTSTYFIILLLLFVAAPYVTNDRLVLPIMA
jgi:hypothetical protein